MNRHDTGRKNGATPTHSQEIRAYRSLAAFSLPSFRVYRSVATMKMAPFLLQAFAARVLAAKPQETISRAELAKQGYDVEVLVEMIDAYQLVPEHERGFAVKATATDIFIRRKPNTPIPTMPTSTGASAPAAPIAPATAPLPASKIKLSDLVKSTTAKDAPKK